MKNYPRGFPYIIANDAAERFSYYGMKAVLLIFMTQYLKDQNGVLATMSEGEAKSWYHLFTAVNYFFPLLGALVADIFWGKYKTIILLSILYCFGHLALALDETRVGLTLGLTLIALGSGGIKPCVSAHLGDQVQQKDAHLLSPLFAWFYLAVNLGAFCSSILTPVFLEYYGPQLAFGVPGIFMLLATILFYVGRHTFIAVPPVGWQTYKKALTSAEGKKAFAFLPFLFLFTALFWSIYDQTGSSWVLQAEHLDRHVNLPFGWQFEFLAAQIQAINPVLIIILIPVFQRYVYPLWGKYFRCHTLQKISVGLWVGTLAFSLITYIEVLLTRGQTVSVLWQLLAYFIITCAEIMVAITAMEFSYSQAPHALKSLMMGLFWLSVSLGNFLTALVNSLGSYLGIPDSGTGYYLFFTALIGVTAFIFSFCTRFYQEVTYLQDGEVSSGH